MLTLTIPASELWDERTERFIYTKQQTLVMEHSLVSLSKWESKWCKPFLTKKEKTTEELLDYFKCMTITQNVSDETYLGLTKENIKAIIEYMNSPMTATTIRSYGPKRVGREQVTAELIYYWMVAFRIPFECQKWHLNRLITLIRICEIKSQKPKKRNRRDVLNEYASINAARQKLHNTKG